MDSSVTPDDLENIQGICYSNLNKSSTWKYQTIKEDTLREAAVARLGVLCEPSFIVHGVIKRGLLKPVLTEYQWYGMNIYAVT